MKEIGFIIAAGAILGALFGSWFSKSYLFELKSFKYLFGYLTSLVVALMIYNILKQRKKKPEQSKKKAERMPSLQGKTVNAYSFFF